MYDKMKLEEAGFVYYISKGGLSRPHKGGFFFWRGGGWVAFEVIPKIQEPDFVSVNF